MTRQHLEYALAELSTAVESIGGARDEIDAVLDKSKPLPVPTIMSGAVLYVPYSSQHEVDAKKFRLDCGAACVEMVGEFYKGQILGVGTNEIHAHMTGGANKKTSAEDLQKALKHFYDVDTIDKGGATPDMLRGWIDEGHPSIVLVRYGDFPLRMDLAYTSGHWMVVCGYDSFDWAGHEVKRLIMHDPDWYSTFMAQGAFLPVIESMFVGMHKDYNRLALVATDD